VLFCPGYGGGTRSHFALASRFTRLYVPQFLVRSFTSALRMEGTTMGVLVIGRVSWKRVFRRVD
jgi:hypothetical protein